MISRASMQRQLKGNRMPTYKTKKGDNIKTIKPISRVGQKLLGMKNVRKTTKKNVGGFLETFSPVYSIAKGKGPIGEAVRGKISAELRRISIDASQSNARHGKAKWRRLHEEKPAD